MVETSVGPEGPLNSDRATLRLLIHGRVQGVGFRYSMREQASTAGIAGWVRNRAEGTVEAVVQGEVRAVENIVAWARHGPRQARVTRVEIQAAKGEYAGFEMRPTA